MFMNGVSSRTLPGRISPVGMLVRGSTAKPGAGSDALIMITAPMCVAMITPIPAIRGQLSFWKYVSMPTATASTSPPTR